MRIEIRTPELKIKEIKYSPEEKENAIKYATTIITQTAQTLYNGKCIIKINNKYATNQETVEKILAEIKQEEIKITIEPLLETKEVDMIAHAKNLPLNTTTLVAIYA